MKNNGEKHKLERVYRKRNDRKREERKDVGNHGQPHPGWQRYLEENNMLRLLIFIYKDITMNTIYYFSF